MISMVAILKMTSYRKFISISGHTIALLDLKNMGLNTKILSLATIKGEIWAKYNLLAASLKKVHPHLMMAASTFHQCEGLRSKLKQFPYCPGEGAGGGSF